MERPLALLVDDEPDILELLALTLSRMNIDSRTATDLRAARAMLRDERFDLCLTDMRLPDGNGLELVDHIQTKHAEIPVAVITAHGNMESAVQALKSGAFDFVSKPVDLDVLRRLVSSALRLRETRESRERGSGLLGESPAMQTTRATIAKLARSQAPVHISGESGTGKELAARLIHEQGPRADGPFVPVNCGAIPEALMESEFFGHLKGSFTGATASKEGLFQAATGGTLFLDEVADLPLHMQVKLLRALQEKAIRPVGAAHEIPTDVRVLSATHKDLHALVRAGAFRQDLFYRINVIDLRMPALRERREDIPELARRLLAQLAAGHGTTPPEIGDDALSALCAYHFPGNVREMENILERAMTLCEARLIRASDLQLSEQINPEGRRGEAHQAGASFDRSSTGASGALPLEPFLGNVERETILRALDQADHNKTAAARLLGISFGALRYRLKKLGLE
ncbi:MAG: sigma-54 dependent transcriptional regulator [Gammaproteobacteria bacterium]|jgi:two-component system response regulator PilR (NtrC family)|nr:sigma-54 dependent transcriptional regulator [Gammaproteobacteria bacterium]